MSINSLEERLTIIKRQKKIYLKKMEEEKDQEKLYDLSRKIKTLDEEEHDLLIKLGVL